MKPSPSRFLLIHASSLPGVTLRLRALVLLTLVFPIAAAEGGYTVNGQSHAANAALEALPQSGRITVDFKEVPVEQALAEISKQSGFPVRFFGGQGGAVTIASERAPLMAVLAELCHQYGWGLDLTNSSEGFEVLNVNGTTDNPFSAYAVHGPLLLVWHGLVTSQQYDFDQEPPGLKEVTKYRMGCIQDPLSHITVVDRARQLTARDIPLFVRLGDGSEVTLESDHKPNQFGSGPQWEFAPRDALSGVTGTLIITLPFEAPSVLEKAVLPFDPGAKAEVGETHILLETASSEKGKVRDPVDYFKELEAVTFKATFKLLRPGGASLQGMPTADEVAAAIGGVRDAHQVELGLQDGTTLPGHFKTASGMSSPWDGYRYVATFQTQALSSKAKEIRIVWARGFSGSQVEMKIDAAEFTRPK